MSNSSAQTRTLGLKALYFLSLAALCLAVVNGPAQAGWIGSTGYTNVVCAMGNIDAISLSDGNIAQKSPTVVALEGLTLNCDGSCFMDVHYGFTWYGYEPGQLDFTLTLDGTSNAADAQGWVSIWLDGGHSQNWTVTGSSLAMTPLQFSIDGDGSPVSVSGMFHASLPSGGLVQWGGTSLDFEILDASAAAPEPTSALLFAAGFGLVEFLRRKIRRR
jgi:hypothetical protein